MKLNETKQKNKEVNGKIAQTNSFCGRSTLCFSTTNEEIKNF